MDFRNLLTSLMGGDTKGAMHEFKHVAAGGANSSLGNVGLVNPNERSSPSQQSAPGLYGLLPEHMQHGALRNVLGALGDAFLVGSGNAPQYRVAKQNRELNEAMGGYNPNDSNSAAEVIKRLSGLSSPGATEMIDHIAKNSGDLEIRRQVADQNNIYRQNSLDARNDQAIRNRTPYIGALVAGAKTLAEYTQRYQRADAIAKQINPSFDASYFGLPDPQDWTPESTANLGMTANNVVQSADRAAGRQTSERNTDVSTAGRITSAGISAGQSNRNNIRSTEQSNTNNIRSTTQSDTNSQRSAGRGGSRALPPGLAVPGAKPQPTAKDIQYLKSNPNARSQFDAHFGAGAAAKALGK